ncbi:MAG: VWA domain-containing protein [Bryobacteraceae bacterium]
MRTKILAAVVASALVTGIVIAQAPAGTETEVPLFRSEVVNIQVPVTVRDAKGNFINGLAPVDFQLLDQGVPQPVKLDIAAHPLSLVIAVQSDSTARQILPTIQKTASIYGPLVAGESGEIAVMGFDHMVRVHTPFTSNPEEIKAGFAKLKPGSSQHHLDDAAMEGVRMLRARGKDRKKVLILISETRDKGSAVNPRDVLTMAEFADVQIYAVSMNHLLNQLTTQAEPNRPNAVPPEYRGTLPMGVMRTGTTDAQQNMGNYAPIFKEIFALVKGIFVPNSLEVYTKFTGGREQNFVSISGLEEAVHEIGEEIHSQYLLTFAAPQNAEGGYHEVEVKVLGNPALKITARSGYWIAPKGPAPKPAAAK